MPLDLLFEIISDAAPELLETLYEEGFDLAEMGLDQVDLEDLHNLDLGEFSTALSGADLSIEAEGILDVIDGEAYTENFYETINEGGLDNNSYIDSVFETDDIFIDESLIDDFTDYPELNNFELSGFGNAEIAQQALFDSVPAEHLEGLSSINYEPEIGINPNTGESFLGKYSSLTKEITLFNADHELNLLVFQHEVGHYVFDQNIELQNLYLKEIVSEAATLNLDISSLDQESFKNLHEQFADEYASYLRNPEGFRLNFPTTSNLIESTLANTSLV